MKLAVDAHYFGEYALTAGVGFERWEANIETSRFLVKNRIPSAYISGEFYKRELPGMLSLLNTVPWSPEFIVIDGYVTLGAGRIGLGGHLFNALDGKVPVIGVAKKTYAGNNTALPLLRGSSRKPLLITAMGIDVADARACVARMAGQYRVPTILKAVDFLARSQASFIE